MNRRGTILFDLGTLAGLAASVNADLAGKAARRVEIEHDAAVDRALDNEGRESLRDEIARLKMTLDAKPSDEALRHLAIYHHGGVTDWNARADAIEDLKRYLPTTPEPVEGEE